MLEGSAKARLVALLDGISIVLVRLVGLVLRILAWPFHKWRQLRRLPLRIESYRGFAGADGVHLLGRLVDTPPLRPLGKSRWARFRSLLQRMHTPPVPHGVVEARFEGAVQRIETRADGLFRVTLPDLVHGDHLRQQTRASVSLEAWPKDGDANHAERRGAAQAEVMVPAKSATHAIISDIDDTVVATGVANKLAMLWTLFATPTAARTAFPGVGAFYRALHRGPRGSGPSPMFYVSRGPWPLYPVIEELFVQADLPEDPVIILRDWGIQLGHPWPRRDRDHKARRIDELIRAYPALRFILIGDSGQEDPEIYTEAVERWGSEHILCSYIRELGDNPRRQRELASLAERCRREGSQMVLADDTATMAAHAASQGYMESTEIGLVARADSEDRALG